MANFGIDQSLLVWKKIIDACSGFLIFEMASLMEIGKELYWKQKISQHYANDNHLLSDLFLMIGPRLESIDIIGRNYISLDIQDSI